MAKQHSKQVPFPTKEEILAFIGDKPGQIGTREIARAFNLKNDRRVELKRLLRELANEGRIESKGKKLLVRIEKIGRFARADLEEEAQRVAELRGANAASVVE